MKKVTLALIAFASTVSFSSIATTDVVPADSQPSSKICAAAANGNVIKFNKEIKNVGFKTKEASTLKCNGVTIAEFAKQHGSEKIAERLAKHQ